MVSHTTTYYWCKQHHRLYSLGLGKWTSAGVISRRRQLSIRWYNNITRSPPGLNGRHFADDIFRCIFVNEKFSILNKFSLKFVPKGLTDNNPAMVQMMVWRHKGDKPLSEPVLTRFTEAFVRHLGVGVGWGGGWWMSWSRSIILCRRFLCDS